jgi:hypothetical protein
MTTIRPEALADSSFQLTTTAQQLYNEWLTEVDQKYTLPDPNDAMIEIYEMDTVKDTLLLRAEKWDSPEWLATRPAANTTGASSATNGNSTTTTGEKIQRNILNPNYAEVMDLLKKLRKADKEDAKLGAFEKLRAWINKFTNLAVSLDDLPYLNPLPDVRYLRFLLGRKEPKIDRHSVILVMAYLKRRYVK